VNCVRYNEDSSIALSGSIDATVKCWDVKSKRQEPVQTLEETKDSVTSIDVSDHEVLVGCGDGRVRRYDLRNGQLMTDYVGGQGRRNSPILED
jgi:mitogen-activated protein kinase organizer 1